MKKLVVSVLLGLLIGLGYLGIMMLVTVPFLLLIRMGFFEIMTEAASVATVVTNITGSVKDITGSLGSVSIIVLVAQVALFVLLSVVTFVFMTKVMKVFLKDDSYFRHLYDAIFVLIMLVPEVLIILSLFFSFPVDITVYVILGITILVVIFALVMANKILPDLMKNQNRKYLLKTDNKAEGDY